MELADLTPDEVFHMPVEDRIELLKSNILHFTKDLLHFDVVEIRLLDQQDGPARTAAGRWAWIPRRPPATCSPSRRTTA